MDIAHIKREATDTYLREIWNEKIEKKINKRILKGQSHINVSAFYYRYSSEMLAEIGKRYGYDTKLYMPLTPFGRYKLMIMW